MDQIVESSSRVAVVGERDRKRLASLGTHINEKADGNFSEQVGIGVTTVTTTRAEYGSWSVRTRGSGRKYYHLSML